MSQDFSQGILTLGAIQRLWSLELRDSKITGLSELTALRALDLGYNNVSTLKKLDALVKLQTLVLGNNPKIETIQGLETLTQLRVLNLALNNIGEIQNLEALTRLGALNLAGNQLKAVAGLVNLSALNLLFIRYNQLPAQHAVDLSNTGWVNTGGTVNIEVNAYDCSNPDEKAAIQEAAKTFLKKKVTFYRA